VREIRDIHESQRRVIQESEADIKETTSDAV